MRSTHMVMVAAALLVSTPAAGAEDKCGEDSHEQLREAGAQLYRRAKAEGDEERQKQGYRTAILKLVCALKRPEAKEDARSRYYLAMSYYALTRLEHAFPMVRGAVALFGDSDHKLALRARGLLEKLENEYGGVRLEKSERAKTEEGCIYLEDVGGLIQVQKKRVFRELQERFSSEPTRLPETIYLPFGSYKINEVPVTTKEGEVPAITIVLDQCREVGVPTWIWWAAAGVGVAAVAAGGAWLLTPEPEPDTYEVRIPAAEGR